MPLYRLLTFDIGGTKTNTALFSGQAEDLMALSAPIFSQAYQNADFSGPEEMMAVALKAAGSPVDMAVLAVAGPVTSEGVRLTNLPWTIDRAALKARFNLPHLHIINDLEAIALGIPYLHDEELQVINDRPATPEATIAVIAPGTGLGESFLTWTQGRYIAHPTEGSHSDFAPVNADQIELLRFMLQTHDHVSYERLCSGLGLQNIYRFLKEHLGVEEPAWLAAKLADEHNPPKTIIAAANDSSRPCDICMQTVSLFVAILGAEAGNLALRTLPSGGLYIGGGIPPRIRSFFTTGRFMTAFRHKGRMQPLLEAIPVKIILNPGIPLYGAAYYGLQSVA
jgi:glucokinase